MGHLLTSFCKYFSVLLLMVTWIIFDNGWNSLQLPNELTRMMTPKHSVSRKHISSEILPETEENLDNLPMHINNSETHLALIERLKNESELEHRPFIVHHVRKMKKWKKPQTSTKQTNAKLVHKADTKSTEYYTSTTTVSPIKTTYEIPRTTDIASFDITDSDMTSTASNERISDKSTTPTISTPSTEVNTEATTKPMLELEEITTFTTQVIKSTLESIKTSPFMKSNEADSKIYSQPTASTHIFKKSTPHIHLRKKKRKVKTTNKRKNRIPEKILKSAKRSTLLGIPNVAALNSKEENNVFLVKSHVKHGGTKWSNKLQVIRNY